MRRKTRSILLALVLCSTFVFPAAALSVLQPNDPSLSPEQQQELVRAIADVSSLLDNVLFASQRTLGPGGWTHAQFAAFTAGFLSSRGCKVLLADLSPSTEVPSTCAFVEVMSQGVPLYVPVNASPIPGTVQVTLGTVPLISGLFDPAYLLPIDPRGTPPTVPPMAGFDAQPRAIEVDNSTFYFDASSSFDPDGQVVLYVWDFGDGGVEASVSSVLAHTYRRWGRYLVTLTVVDASGASNSSVLLLTVTVPNDSAPSTPGDGGCGCGGG